MNAGSLLAGWCNSRRKRLVLWRSPVQVLAVLPTAISVIFLILSRRTSRWYFETGHDVPNSYLFVIYDRFPAPSDAYVGQYMRVTSLCTKGNLKSKKCGSQRIGKPKDRWRDAVTRDDRNLLG